MKSFKELIRSRRGIAIEFAIGVMLVSVAISTILISTAVLEGERRRSDMDKFNTFISESNLASIVGTNFEERVKVEIDHGYTLGNVVISSLKDGVIVELTLIAYNEPIFEFELKYDGSSITTITYNQSDDVFTYDWH